MTQLNALLSKTIRAALWIGGAIVFFRWLLVPLLPFLLALALSAMAEPAVARISRGLRMRRGPVAAAVTTLLLVVVGGGAALLLAKLTGELQDWAGRLPEVMAGVPALWNGLLDKIGNWYDGCPAFLRSALDALAVQVTENGSTLAGSVGGWLMSAVSSLLSALPDAGLFLVTTVLAVYFTSLSYPAILGFLKRQLPEAWQDKCRDAAWCFRSTLLKWLRSQLLLILMTFALLFTGFIWMGLDYALLAASFIALVDALPVLGTGTILIPWAAVMLLIGQGGRAAALVGLYALCSLAHSLLEPRLLAGQADLPPISALLAMYVGFQFLGVGGMLLFPIVLLLLKQLQDAEVIKVWK